MSSRRGNPPSRQKPGQGPGMAASLLSFLTFFLGLTLLSLFHVHGWKLMAFSTIPAALTAITCNVFWNRINYSPRKRGDNYPHLPNANRATRREVERRTRR